MRLIVLALFITSAQCLNAQEYVSGKELFDQINEFRRRHFRRTLVYDSSQQKQTDKFANRIVTKFSHGRREYSLENIALTTGEYSDLFELWKYSKGHRKNMLYRSIRYGTVSVYLSTRKGKMCYFAVFRGYIKKAR